MNRKIFLILSYMRAIAYIFLLTLLAAPPAFSQNSGSSGAAPQQQQQQPSSSAATTAADEKAEQVLKRALEAMGGSAYMSVRSVVGQGLFTPYRDGQSTTPVKFVDYIVYPDRERTEFRGQGLKIIQTNTGDKGWVYDGEAKTLKDATPQQVADFRLSLRASFDNLLRGAWRKEGARLSYIGRREAGLGQRNEAVRLVYPDDLTIEFEVGARDARPAKIISKRKDAKGEEVLEEDHLAQHVMVNGILAPFIIDHYRNGVQSSRTNYESIEFNRAVADDLFVRPASAKDVKWQK
ncbi:MAG TPA: hypothetical protein VF708_03425 [Pyrinomonadaceae bacterium]